MLGPLVRVSCVGGMAVGGGVLGCPVPLGRLVRVNSPVIMSSSR